MVLSNFKLRELNFSDYKNFKTTVGEFKIDAVKHRSYRHISHIALKKGALKAETRAVLTPNHITLCA